MQDTWGTMAIRVTDLAVTPDLTRLVTVGMHHVHPSSETTSSRGGAQAGDTASLTTGGNGVPVNGSRISDNRMIIYDLETKQTES